MFYKFKTISTSVICNVCVVIIDKIEESCYNGRISSKPGGGELGTFKFSSVLGAESMRPGTHGVLKLTLWRMAYREDRRTEYGNLNAIRIARDGRPLIQFASLAD